MGFTSKYNFFHIIFGYRIFLYEVKEFLPPFLVSGSTCETENANTKEQKQPSYSCKNLTNHDHHCKAPNTS